MSGARSRGALAAGCGLLLIVAIVAASAATRQPEARYPAGSPEATVASYLHLLQAGQVDQAFALTALRSDYPGVEPLMTLQRFHDQYDGWSQKAHRAILVRSSRSGQSASVTVDLSAFSGGTFGASDTTNRQTFTLVRQAATWRITGPQYLWP